MIVKELIEARWKLIVGALVGVSLATANAFTFGSYSSAFRVDPDAVSGGPRWLSEMVRGLTDADSFFWTGWFASNGPQMLTVLAAVLGAGLVASEVGQGTIFFLLSRPVSRERILLTKWVVGAGGLFAVTGLSSAALVLGATLTGHPQHLGGALISTVLLWLGLLFVMGIALALSVIFGDTLRSVALTLALTIVVALPGFFGSGSTWSLVGYWSDLDAYLGRSFPVTELLVCLVAAALPPLVALHLFRRRAY